jgi:phospholipid/cholesterol/gamma-HCH transport system substrate-binding protein
MESKLNYTVVGLFVLLLLAGMIASGLWLTGQNKDQQYTYYRIHMTESVSGLALDSTVKYLGVDVGNVTQIRLNPEDSQQVEIIIQVEQNVPVTVATTATLKFFGITGLAFIELSGSPREAAKLVSSDDKMPVIKAGSSTFARAEESLNTLAVKSIRVLDRLELLINETNIDNISQLIEQSTYLVNDLREDQRKFSSLLEQSEASGAAMEQAFTKLATVSGSVDKLTQQFASSGQVVEQQLSTVLQHIAQASQSIEQLALQYQNVGDQTAVDVNKSLLSFRRLLAQLDSLVSDMKSTVQTLGDSPSDMLFKHSQQKLGPGE